MNYPIISEYVEAIKVAEDNFEVLTNLRPVLDADGEPVMTSGNWKSHARLTPEGKATVTPENFFVLTPVKS